MVPRHLFSIRLSDEAVKEVDKMADDEGRTRADMIRRLIAEAISKRLGRKLKP